MDLARLPLHGLTRLPQALGLLVDCARVAGPLVPAVGSCMESNMGGGGSCSLLFGSGLGFLVAGSWVCVHLLSVGIIARRLGGIIIVLRIEWGRVVM